MADDKEECHYEEKVVYKDECVPYVERKCHTHHQQHCKDITADNCTALVQPIQDRECFNVTELLCELVESVNFEVIEETFTVQRCKQVEDRLCDTVFDLDSTRQDDYQCVDIDHSYCWTTHRVIKDRTCVFSIDFECGGKNLVDSEDGDMCEKVATKKCHDTPRKVNQEVCKPRVSKWCEKFTNVFPHPVERQNCRTEPVRRCELETKSRPRQAKKFSYTKNCKPVTRQVCDDREKKQLHRKCGQVRKTSCHYIPVEQCQDVQKQQCFQREVVLGEKLCLPNKGSYV